MKEIPLTRGKVAVVDDDDFDRLSQVKWHYSPEGYARNRWSLGYMHRAIMGDPTGMKIDHIDGNKLNNTKANLRICTGQQNNFNQQWKRPRTHFDRSTGHVNLMLSYRRARRFPSPRALVSPGLLAGLFYAASNSSGTHGPDSLSCLALIASLTRTASMLLTERFSSSASRRTSISVSTGITSWNRSRPPFGPRFFFSPSDIGTPSCRVSLVLSIADDRQNVNTNYTSVLDNYTLMMYNTHIRKEKQGKTEQHR